MTGNTNEAKKRKSLNERWNDWVDIVIAIVLAVITLLTLPDGLNSSIVYWFGDGEAWEKNVVLGGVWFFAVLISGLYICKVKFYRRKAPIDIDFAKERKTNQINQTMFTSLYDANADKIREILRYTYGSVPDWNPINYIDNVLVYDVHEQIRSILIGLERTIINLDPERFNDQNVSVELVYCYPADARKYNVEDIAKLPFDRDKLNEKDHPWKLISSGDTSGNQKSVLEYLSLNNSFYTFLECWETVFRNNKFEEIPEFQKKRITQHLGEVGETVCSESDFYFIEDIRDCERARGKECIGSAIGMVINLRNDNPEEVFVKAILTINTYGVQIYDSDKYNGAKDEYGFNEADYEVIIRNTILSTYSKMIETELAQMYIRHTIRSGVKCPITGRVLTETKEKDRGIVRSVE